MQTALSCGYVSQFWKQNILIVGYCVFLYFSLFGSVSKVTNERGCWKQRKNRQNELTFTEYFMGRGESIWEGEFFFNVDWFIFCCFLEEHMGTNNSIFSFLCPQTVCRSNNSDPCSKLGHPILFL